MNKISLDKIAVNKNKVEYYFSVIGNLKKYFKKDYHMFLEYNHDLSNIPKSILAIPFISNVIPLVWITDSTILIEQLDYSFFQCLDNIKKAYQRMFPNVEFKGQILVNEVIKNYYVPEREAACLFSGGLDAHTTFIRNKNKNPLLITEYGWHENEIKKSEVWNTDKENAINFAQSYGLENILIQSNYGTFIIASNIDSDFSKRLGDSWWHGLHHSLAIISAAIPVAYELKVKCIYIASSYFKGYKAKCASDPTVDNEIKFGSGTVYHDGYEYNRQEKVKVVVDYYSSTNEPVNLRVCFKNKENCCKCEKCLRTILGIVAEGKDPRNYGFNIPNNLSKHVKEFLKEDVKFFTPARIMQWNLAKKRMEENYDIILYRELLDWFLEYDFITQRKKALIKYRVTKFIPILKRRIRTKLGRMLTQER